MLQKKVKNLVHDMYNHIKLMNCASTLFTLFSSQRICMVFSINLGGLREETEEGEQGFIDALKILRKSTRSLLMV